MIRRITATAAGLALAGTAFAAAPAMAKTNTTVITLDAGLVSAAADAGVTVSPIKKAKLSSDKLTIPAKLKGNTVTHNGGITFKGTVGSVGLKDFIIDWKNGNTAATAVLGTTEAPLTKVLKVTGGKKTAKSWKNATLKLNKSVDFGGSVIDPAATVNNSLTGDATKPFKTGQTIGKITITLK